MSTVNTKTLHLSENFLKSCFNTLEQTETTDSIAKINIQGGYSGLMFKLGALVRLSNLALTTHRQTPKHDQLVLDASELLEIANDLLPVVEFELLDVIREEM